MKFKELVNDISAEFNMPASDAKKMANFVLGKLKNIIDQKEQFSSPIIRITTRQTTARSAISKATGQLETFPAQTIGVIKLKN
jgi:hypothetical protein